MGGGGGAATAYDEKEVKRAFLRMTKLYHPDAVTNKDSTEAERRQANDDFARINAAYQAIVNPEAAEVPKVCRFVVAWCGWFLLLVVSFFFFCYFRSIQCNDFPSLQLAFLSSREPSPLPKTR